MEGNLVGQNNSPVRRRQRDAYGEKLDQGGGRELRSMAGKCSTAQIAQELGRTLGSVKTKGNDMTISLRFDRPPQEPKSKDRRPTSVDFTG